MISTRSLNHAVFVSRKFPLWPTVELFLFLALLHPSGVRQDEVSLARSESYNRKFVAELALSHVHTHTHDFFHYVNPFGSYLLNIRANSLPFPVNVRAAGRRCGNTDCGHIERTKNPISRRRHNQSVIVSARTPTRNVHIAHPRQITGTTWCHRMSHRERGEMEVVKWVRGGEEKTQAALNESRKEERPGQELHERFYE